MLFMGEEWAAGTPFQYFTDHQDPELAAAVSEGRRRDYGDVGWREDDLPDPQAYETFLQSRLQWEERALPEHGAMLEWYRILLSLRREFTAPESPGIGKVSSAADPKGTWLWMRRGHLLVAAALFGPARIPLQLASGSQILLTAGAAHETAETLNFPGAGIVVAWSAECGKDQK